MSGSGAGRGRGWLNLNKNPAARPGGVPSATTNSNNYIDSLSQDFYTATMNVQVPQYPRLVALLEQLDPNDDGILLNQKLKNILQNWKNKCNSGAEVEESFKCVYSKCLEDASVATKVVTMVSSYSFISEEVHDVKIRNLFIAHIQNDFENRKHLQATNPTGFRNSVRMLGEFYHKARLADGRSIKFLATPIVRYFDMLLETAQPADLELFTSQLYLNGPAIKTDCPQKIQDILMQVRHLLLNNTNLTQVCRTWMLLALDVFYNRFGLLPNEIHKFYQEQLGDKAMGNFQVKFISSFNVSSVFCNHVHGVVAFGK